MKIFNNPDEGNKHTLMIACTEREARAIAQALGIHADMLFGASQTCNELGEQFRRLQHHGKEANKWAKELFEKVGY